MQVEFPIPGFGRAQSWLLRTFEEQTSTCNVYVVCGVHFHLFASLLLKYNEHGWVEPQYLQLWHIIQCNKFLKKYNEHEQIKFIFKKVYIRTGILTSKYKILVSESMLLCNMHNIQQGKNHRALRKCKSFQYLKIQSNHYTQV